MSAQNTEPKENQPHSHKMAHKTALQPGTYQHAEAKGCNHRTPHDVLPAHKNTPRISICGGCMPFNRQDKLFSLHRTGQALRQYRLV